MCAKKAQVLVNYIPLNPSHCWHNLSAPTICPRACSFHSFITFLWAEGGTWFKKNQPKVQDTLLLKDRSQNSQLKLEVKMPKVHSPPLSEDLCHLHI